MNNTYHSFFRDRNIDLLNDVFLKEFEGSTFFIDISKKDESLWEAPFNTMYNNFKDINIDNINNFNLLFSYFNRSSEICETKGADYLYKSLIREVNSNSKSSLVHIPIKKDGKTYILRLKILRFVDKGIIFGFLSMMDNIGVNYEELIACSYKDSLTGLFNRTTFNLHLEKAREGKHYIGFMDLDNFKYVNDTYSHQRGDKLLHDIGNIMIRDIANKNIIFYRFGGDEFMFFTNEYTKEQTEATIKKLCSLLVKLRINKYTPTFSVGYFGVDFSDNNIPRDKLINLADMAMYEAKSSGKDKITYFSQKEIQKNLQYDSFQTKAAELRQRYKRMS